jgi:hypothetical protein
MIVVFTNVFFKEKKCFLEWTHRFFYWIFLALFLSIKNAKNFEFLAFKMLLFCEIILLFLFFCFCQAQR